MTMIIRIWICLAILSCFAQIVFAYRKVPHFIGLLLPALFLGFGIYAWIDLASVGILITVILAFMIPPILLLCVFELAYWISRYKELCNTK